jgi:(p)ppGpp synthase/HD superfamily hydrolase
VQVRSEEMHKIAEYRLAAHWEHKLGSREVEALPQDKLIHTNCVEVNGIQENVLLPEVKPPSDSSYVEALVTAKHELLHNKIFVFFAGTEATANEVQILSLPVGAKVKDAIESLAGMIGFELVISEGPHDFVVSKNGVETTFHDVVSNGDVLLINLRKM